MLWVDRKVPTLYGVRSKGLHKKWRGKLCRGGSGIWTQPWRVGRISRGREKTFQVKGPAQHDGWEGQLLERRVSVPVFPKQVTGRLIEKEEMWRIDGNLNTKPGSLDMIPLVGEPLESLSWILVWLSWCWRTVELMIKFRWGELEASKSVLLRVLTLGT